MLAQATRGMILAGVVLASVGNLAAQERVPKVGVILHGGPWHVIVDGLREGLKDELADKKLALEIRDTKGNLKEVERAAADLERDKVDLIYTVTTSVSLSARSATKRTPIVFAAGTDPLAVKLVDSIRVPGGRLTGVHFRATGIVGKRIELLREIAPRMRRVIIFYNPGNRSALAATREARQAAQQLQLELLERHIASIDELLRVLRTFVPNDTDGYLNVGDAMIDSQAGAIIAMATAKKLPAMFYQEGVVERGGLASYSADFKEVGRLSAKFVRRILSGSNPANLPVEAMDKYSFAINLRTAKQIGLSIPESLLLRADRVFE